MSSPDLIAKYQEILAKNGYEGTIIRSVNVTTPNLQGEHMASTCKYVTLELGDDGGKKLELFVKEMPENKTHAEFLEDYNIFAREAQFFNELLPDMQKFYAEKSGSTKPLDFFPKCFYADDKEIIMENLKTQGYEMSSKTERQDLEHATMAVEKYAQFHAVGYAMVAELGREPLMEKYGCLEEFMFTHKNPVLMGLFENTKLTAIGLLKTINTPKGEEALRTLEKYSENFWDCLCYLASAGSDHVFHVIGHGDAWNNNMMFLKDSETAKLKHIVLIDFQLTRCASPSMDLTYFFFTSVKSDVRKEHLKQLLRSYFEKLSAQVQHLTKTPFPYTFEQFLHDFKYKSLTGFWMNILFSISMEVLATIDPTKMEGDIATYIQNSIGAWIEGNPEKSKESALKLIEFFEDYDQFLTAV